MKIIKTNGEELKGDEAICPNCGGSGRIEETTFEEPSWRIDNKDKAEPFDLDCCQICKGEGIVIVGTHPKDGFYIEPIKD